MKIFGKKFGRKSFFGNLSKIGVPYLGAKYKDKKGNSKSATVSPTKINLYTKDKIGKDYTLKTKTNLHSMISKIKFSKTKKSHY